MMQKKRSVAELRMRGVVKLKDNDMFSLWVKTACCNLNSNQLRKLAEITETYARGYLLFTTRQIPIIPHVNEKDVEKATEELNKVYLELDRCGPTVRNVNVCYDDKICPLAVTNSLTLGEKMDNFFRVPMAHKVKIGVSGCPKDCVISRVLNDIGFIAVERNGNKGYDAFIGGRLGVKPFVGIKVSEGLSEEECGRLVQNYFELMNKEGKGEERAADLITRLGEARFKTELNKNLKQNSGLLPVKCESLQKESQLDKTIVRIRATCGEVNAKQLRKIAELTDKYGNGFVHFVVRGSPEIPCVNKKDLPAVRQGLKEVGLDTMDKGIDNLQTCFGAYCGESNADPQSLLRRIEKLVADLDLNNNDIKISASGCPNACGIPQVNDIGFMGTVKPVIDAAKCSGCGICAPICKRKAIVMKDGVAVLNDEECRNCGQCITVCPVDAIIGTQKGFTVLVGGQEGEDTRLGLKIAEFLSEEEAFGVAERGLKLIKENKKGMASLIDELGLAKVKAKLVPAARKSKVLK